MEPDTGGAGMIEAPSWPTGSPDGSGADARGRHEEPRSKWVSVFDEGALASDAVRCLRQLGQLAEARLRGDSVAAADRHNFRYEVEMR